MGIKIRKSSKESFPKENIQMENRYMKKGFSITNYQGKASQNHNEISPNT